jgi:hypothetical protein
MHLQVCKIQEISWWSKLTIRFSTCELLHKFVYLYGTVNINNLYITKFTNFKNYIFFKGFTVIVSIYTCKQIFNKWHAMNMRDHESPYRLLAYIICISINIICSYHLPLRRGPTISQINTVNCLCWFQTFTVINYVLNYFLGLLHMRLRGDNVAYVSKIHAVSICRVKVCKLVSCFAFQNGGWKVGERVNWRIYVSRNSGLWTVLQKALLRAKNIMHQQNPKKLTFFSGHGSGHQGKWGLTFTVGKVVEILHSSFLQPPPPHQHSFPKQNVIYIHIQTHTSTATNQYTSTLNTETACTY